MKIIKNILFLLYPLSLPLYILWGIAYGVSEYLDDITDYWIYEIRRKHRNRKFKKE